MSKEKKLTYYIRKGQKIIGHTTCNVITQKEDGTYCGCAMGEALVGKLGLEKVLEVGNDERVYTLFEQEFGIIPSKVWGINDKYEEGKEGAKQTLRKLVELGY